MHDEKVTKRARCKTTRFQVRIINPKNSLQAKESKFIRETVALNLPALRMLSLKQGV